MLIEHDVIVLVSTVVSAIGGMITILIVIGVLMKYCFTGARSLIKLIKERKRPKFDYTIQEDLVEPEINKIEGGQIIKTSKKSSAMTYLNDDSEI